jgi:type I restriction enzyme M protein
MPTDAVTENLPESIVGELYSEADVQAKVVVPFLAAAGYQDATRGVKISYQYPITAQQGQEKRTIYADVVVQMEDSPVIVVDSKSPRQELTDNDREQVISYARLLWKIAPYAAVCNGRAWRIYDAITKQQISRLPTYSEVKRGLVGRLLPVPQRESLVGQAKRTLLAIDSAKELSRLMRRCHDVIRNLKGYDPTKAFDELSKVLFAKMYEEREIQDGGRTVNRFTTTEVQRMRHAGVEIIATLWRDTVKSDRYKEVFSDQDSVAEIELPPQAIDKIVALLEDKSLGLTDLDIKGVAFEEFLSATYRGGGLGQYFTPREVVNFMVDLVTPCIGDKVIDPACGSGGFLIRVYDVLKEMTLTSDLSPSEKKAKLRELAQSSLVGIDWEPRAARTCKMNMIIHGDGHAGVYQGNSLDIDEIKGKVLQRQRVYSEAPSIEEGTFDVVLTNPPFGAHDDQPGILRHYQLGGNIRQKREVLLIERCIRLLRPGGRMAIVLPEGILSNKDDKKIRSYIRQECIVKAVIRLPQDAFKMSEGAACTSILFAAKKDPESEKLLQQGDIFFARAEYIGISPSGSTIDRNDLLSIREHFARYERGEWDGIEMRPSGQDDNRMYIVRGVHSSGGDWLEPEVNRTSLLYDRLSYVVRSAQIKDRFSYTYNHPNYYRLMKALDSMPVNVVTLESLCQENFPVRGKSPNEESVEGIPVIKVRNVTTDGISLDTDYAPDSEDTRKRTILLQSGDLLITCTGEGTIGRVATYRFQEPAIADGHIAICRFRDAVNGQYVEEFLRSEYGQIQMLRHVSGSTGQTELLIGWVKNLRVPLPEPEIQTKIVEDMREARLSSKELAAEARHLRKRAATVLAAARTRMIGRIGNQEPAFAYPEPRNAEEQFKSYSELWKRQTRHLSSVTKTTAHQAYREIVRMGMAAVPFILKELAEKPDHWFVALHEITGADPVPKESQGRVEEMAEAWLAWGKARGYIR